MRERLLALLTRKPFQSFRLHLSSGIQHTIVHPDQAVIVGAYLDLSTNASAGLSQLDSIFVAPIHVVQIEPLPPITLNGQQVQ